jgi:hypothetical protein
VPGGWVDAGQLIDFVLKRFLTAPRSHSLALARPLRSLGGTSPLAVCVGSLPAHSVGRGALPCPAFAGVWLLCFSSLRRLALLLLSSLLAAPPSGSGCRAARSAPLGAGLPPVGLPSLAWFGFAVLAFFRSSPHFVMQFSAARGWPPSALRCARPCCLRCCMPFGGRLRLAGFFSFRGCCHGVFFRCVGSCFSLCLVGGWPLVPCFAVLSFSRLCARFPLVGVRVWVPHSARALVGAAGRCRCPVRALLARLVVSRSLARCRLCCPCVGLVSPLRRFAAQWFFFAPCLATAYFNRFLCAILKTCYYL